MDGFLEVADRFVGLAFLVEGNPEVVMSDGVIRFQPDGLLVQAECLVDLAVLEDGLSKVVVRDMVVLRDCQRMPE